MSVQISSSSFFEQAGVESSRLPSHPKSSSNSVGIWVHLAFKTSQVPFEQDPKSPEVLVSGSLQKAEGDGCAQPRGQESLPQML